MEQGEYDKMCEAAFTKANVYYKQINLKNYYTLFSQ